MAYPSGPRRGILQKNPSHGVARRSTEGLQMLQNARFDFPFNANNLSRTQSRGIVSTSIPSAGGIGEYIQP